jgi:hypothetical protein
VHSAAQAVSLSNWPLCCAHMCAGFVKTNLMKSNTTVGLRDDSPYNKFTHVSMISLGIWHT